MRDAHGAVRAPGRFEFQPGRHLRLLDPEPVGDIDERAVARARTIVAAVIGAEHVDAGAVEIAERNPVPGVPGAVSHERALAFGAARAGEAEPPGAVRDREAGPSPMRVG